MGYLRGLMHGAMAGAVLGILYAPEPGAVTRRRVSRWLGQAEAMLSAPTPSHEGESRTSGRRRPVSGAIENRAKRP